MAADVAALHCGPPTPLSAIEKQTNWPPGNPVSAACSGEAVRGTTVENTPLPVDEHDGDATDVDTHLTVSDEIGGVPRSVGADTGMVKRPAPLDVGVEMPGVDGGPVATVA